MMHRMYEYLQDFIPAWVISLLIVMMLFWFTLSGVLMVAAGTIWSLAYWTVALVWCFFKALRAPAVIPVRHDQELPH